MKNLYLKLLFLFFLLFSSTHFVQAYSLEAFTDVDNDYFYSPHISRFLHAGVITGQMECGRPNGLYKGFDNINRAEFSKLVTSLRILENHEDDYYWQGLSSTDFISKVDESLLAYYSCQNQLCEEFDHSDPYSTMNYLQLCSSVNQSSNICLSIGGSEFLDVPGKSRSCDLRNNFGTYDCASVSNCEPWFAPFVYYAVNKGFVKGYGDGFFGPSHSIKRIHALKMLMVDNGNIPAAQDKRYQILDSLANRNNSYSPKCLMGAEPFILSNNLNKDHSNRQDAENLLDYAILADRLNFFGNHCELFHEYGAETSEARAKLLDEPMLRQEAPRYFSLSTTYDLLKPDPNNDFTINTPEENLDDIYSNYYAKLSFDDLLSNAKNPNTFGPSDDFEVDPSIIDEYPIDFSIPADSEHPYFKFRCKNQGSDKWCIVGSPFFNSNLEGRLEGDISSQFVFNIKAALAEDTILVENNIYGDTKLSPGQGEISLFIDIDNSRGRLGGDWEIVNVDFGDRISYSFVEFSGDIELNLQSFDYGSPRTYPFLRINGGRLKANFLAAIGGGHIDVNNCALYLNGDITCEGDLIAEIFGPGEGYESIIEGDLVHVDLDLEVQKKHLTLNVSGIGLSVWGYKMVNDVANLHIDVDLLIGSLETAVKLQLATPAGGEKVALEGILTIENIWGQGDRSSAGLRGRLFVIFLEIDGEVTIVNENVELTIDGRGQLHVDGFEFLISPEVLATIIVDKADPYNSTVCAEAENPFEIRNPFALTNETYSFSVGAEFGIKQDEARIRDKLTTLGIRVIDTYWFPIRVWSYGEVCVNKRPNF